MKNALITIFAAVSLALIGMVFAEEPVSIISLDEALAESAIVSINQIPGEETPQEKIQAILSGETTTKELRSGAGGGLGPKNLTQNLVAGVAGDFLREGIKGSDIPLEELVDQILKERLNIGEDEFNPQIDEARLVIIENPTPNDYTKYVDVFKNVNQEYFSGIRDTPSEITVDAFENLELSNQKITKIIYALPAPRSLSAFHKEYLRLLSVHGEALRSLVDYENDPLKAVVAVRIFEETTNEIKVLMQSLAKNQ